VGARARRGPPALSGASSAGWARFLDERDPAALKALATAAVAQGAPLVVVAASAPEPALVIVRARELPRPRPQGVRRRTPRTRRRQGRRRRRPAHDRRARRARAPHRVRSRARAHGRRRGSRVNIYPAIDLLDGKIARLERGKPRGAHDLRNRSGRSGPAVCGAAGAALWLHVVDLIPAHSATRRRTYAHVRRVTEEASRHGMRVQAGGGLRAASDHRGPVRLRRRTRRARHGRGGEPDAHARTASTSTAAASQSRIDARDGEVVSPQAGPRARAAARSTSRVNWPAWACCRVV